MTYLDPKNPWTLRSSCYQGERELRERAGHSDRVSESGSVGSKRSTTNSLTTGTT